MSTKQDLIKEMLEMQKKFSAYEKANGVDPQEYFTPEAGSEFDGYRAKYQELANKVIDMAHKEAGSERQNQACLYRKEAAHVAAFFVSAIEPWQTSKKILLTVWMQMNANKKQKNTARETRKEREKSFF